MEYVPKGSIRGLTTREPRGMTVRLTGTINPLLPALADVRVMVPL
jgi:hypothetical protein